MTDTKMRHKNVILEQHAADKYARSQDRFFLEVLIDIRDSITVLHRLIKNEKNS